MQGASQGSDVPCRMLRSFVRYPMNIILASGSPRRREILSSLGVRFSVLAAGTDETCDKTDPGELTEVLSLRKARAAAEQLRKTGDMTDRTLIIASDTVVAAPDGEILGKPHTRADADRMLRLLSGRRHTVVSGIALILGCRELTAHAVTAVDFDPIPEKLLEAYLDSDEPYDKAGAYAIQGHASVWIRGIEGDYFNVVGLPVNLLAGKIRELTGKELCDLADA